ncbi:hypothetical protein Bamy02_13660 [Bacillus amyloliquefaciens]|nr:hypothetical protein Bamy02_13660 [Bacillus amyloliquefaciens]
MDQSRYQQGLDKLMEYTLTNDDKISTHLKISEDLKDIAPDVSKYIIEFAYGDIYSRPGLTNQHVRLLPFHPL